MGRVTLKIEGYKCERCDHEWAPRSPGAPPPRVCPNCKSPYWDIPRKKKK
jgi:DNA-directed RNA polymerase subunit RPC12/RpoP